MGVLETGLESIGIGGFSALNLASIVSQIVGVLIIAGVIGGLLYWYLIIKQYRFRIVIWERQSGDEYAPLRRDKAKVIKVGKGGQAILYLMKNRVYRTAYVRKLGTNTIHFAIAPDGYWHNVIFKDLVAESGRKLVSVDPAMQYQYVALEQTIEDRYKKKDWSALVTTLSLIGLIFVIGVIAWLWFREWSSTMSIAKEVLATQQDVLRELGRILGSLDNIQSSSGVVAG